MPSQPLQFWLTDRKKALDEIEAAHRRVGGTAPGRRHATQQLNYAYAVLLSSQFQGFCRELHDECMDRLLEWIMPVGARAGLRITLEMGRKLDAGNPNPGNIGSDFGRFGLKFWDRVYELDERNRTRRKSLQELNAWRNAIAHHDPELLATRSLRLRHVTDWRRVCENLAYSFDEVMRIHIGSITGSSPW